MKYFIGVLLFFILSAFAFIYPSRTEAYECMNVNVSLPSISNWPGGTVKVRCYGGQDSRIPLANPACRGETAELSPANPTATLRNCDCNFSNRGSCVIVEKQPNSCQLSVDNYCEYGNGATPTNGTVVGSCTPPSGPTSPPGGPTEGPGGPTSPPGGPTESPGGPGGPPGQSTPGQPSESPSKPTETPVPSSAPGCNIECAIRDNCQSETQKQMGCTECLPDTNGVKRCVPPPSPTPSEAVTPGPSARPSCNMPCSTPKDCEGVKDTNGNDCTQCLPDSFGNKHCVPAPTPTPTGFNEAMCECDQIKNTSPIFSDSDVSFTAYGVVKGENVNKANITSISFSATESNVNNPNIGKQLFNPPIVVNNPRVIEKTDVLKKYQADVSFHFPVAKTNTIYRVYATIKCVPVQTAMKSSSTAVLASTDVDPNNLPWYCQGIMNNGFTRAIGLCKNSSSSGGNNSAQRRISPTPGTQQRAVQQANELKPADVVEKSCRFVTFQFNGLQ